MAFKLNLPPSQHFTLFVILILSLSLNHLNKANAASGGVMGGSSFTSQEDSKSTSFTSFDEDDNSYYRRRHHSRFVDRNQDSDSQGQEGGGSGSGSYAVLMFFVGVVGFFIYLDFKNTKSSVIIIQVGLSGKAQSLQRDLNVMAKKVDTSNAKGWNYILTETVLTLLRHPEDIISGYSSVQSKWSLEKAEKHFRQLSTQERAKFDIEALVNVNNIKTQRTNVPIAHKLFKDYIVVTILVAARGSHQLPGVHCVDDLNKALHYLSTIKPEKTLGVEVLWSPQDDNDVLSEEVYLEHYPLLRPI